jgi:hypothetical protein
MLEEMIHIASTVVQNRLCCSIKAWKKNRNKQDRKGNAGLGFTYVKLANNHLQ